MRLASASNAGPATISPTAMHAGISTAALSGNRRTWDKFALYSPRPWRRYTGHLARRAGGPHHEQMPENVTLETRRDPSSAQESRAGLRRRDLLFATGVSILLSGNALARPAAAR